MISREIGLFLVVGSLTVLIDYCIYYSLLWENLVSVGVAKGIGFITGTLFSYFANRFWTFGHKSHAAGSAWRFSLLYAVTLSANIGINSLAVNLFNAISGSPQYAFLIATAVSASLNFVGMKSFVFKVDESLRLN